MKLSAFLALAISAVSLPLMAMESTNGAGVFGRLPKDVRSLIYQCLDEVALAKLERTSATMDHDIEATVQWRHRADALKLEFPAETTESHCKLALKRDFIRRKAEWIYLKENKHGLKEKELYLQGHDFGPDFMLNFVDLSGANLIGTNLPGAQFNSCIFRRAKMNGANLQKAIIGGDFEGADLTGANLQEAILSARFVNTNLNGANLLNAQIGGSDFCGADLRNTGLTRKILEAANNVVDDNTLFSPVKMKDKVRAWLGFK